jgi:hypothetical protein
VSEGVFVISTNSKKKKELRVTEKENFQSVPEKICVTPVTIMASTSRASHKRVKDTEIFQELEESTDSDVTIFSSEEDEDGYEPDSDKDRQLNDNSETNKNGGTRTRKPKISSSEMD